MEENIIVEQSAPTTYTSPVAEVARVENAVEEEQVGVDSTLGKFKDVAKLKEAYDNLQSEFTRKCQRLSELEKKDNATSLVAPEYQKETWKDNLVTFLEHNPQAKKYASEIGQILLKDKDLACRQNSLELAWGAVMKKHFVDANDVGQQPDFFDKYIKDNEGIKNKIIKEYLEGVQHHTVPPLMKGVSSGVSLIEKVQAPTNLEEAREVVARMFR